MDVWGYSTRQVPGKESKFCRLNRPNPWSRSKDTPIKGFVVDRIKANLLTEDNLRELVKLTNEEIGQAKEQYEERLAVIEAQLEDVRRRLHKLYDALETGKLEVEDLAPRIKELKA
jgi:site-specific DNA recombinase